MHDARTRNNRPVFSLTIKSIYIMEKKKTLVIGASANPSRYSYLAVQRLSANQHPVVALGIRKGSIGNTEIETEKKPFEQVDTITLYLNPARQKEYYDYIL